MQSSWLSMRKGVLPARIAGCSRPISRAALLLQRCQTRTLCTMRSGSFVVCCAAPTGRREAVFWECAIFGTCVRMCDLRITASGSRRVPTTVDRRYHLKIKQPELFLIREIMVEQNRLFIYTCGSHNAKKAGHITSEATSRGAFVIVGLVQCGWCRPKRAERAVSTPRGPSWPNGSGRAVCGANGGTPVSTH